jgi:hypothetical protein
VHFSESKNLRYVPSFEKTTGIRRKWRQQWVKESLCRFVVCFKAVSTYYSDKGGKKNE